MNQTQRKARKSGAQQRVRKGLPITSESALQLRRGFILQNNVNRKAPALAPQSSPFGRAMNDQQLVFSWRKGARVERARRGRGTYLFNGRGKSGGSNLSNPKI